MINDYMRREFDAMQGAYDLFAPLDEAQRRRAVCWLAAKLDVDVSQFEPVTAREALDAAETRLGGPR